MGKYTRIAVVNENEVVKDLREWLDKNESENLERTIFARNLTVKKVSATYPDDMPKDEVETKVNDAWNNPQLAYTEVLKFVVRKHKEDRYTVAYGKWDKGRWSNWLGVRTDREGLVDMAWFVIGCASDDPRTSGQEVKID